MAVADDRGDLLVPGGMAGQQCVDEVQVGVVVEDVVDFLAGTAPASALTSEVSRSVGWDSGALGAPGGVVTVWRPEQAARWRPGSGV